MTIVVKIYARTAMKLKTDRNHRFNLILFGNCGERVEIRIEEACVPNAGNHTQSDGIHQVDTNAGHHPEDG